MRSRPAHIRDLPLSELVFPLLTPREVAQAACACKVLQREADLMSDDFWEPASESVLSPYVCKGISARTCGRLALLKQAGRALSSLTDGIDSGTRTLPSARLVLLSPAGDQCAVLAKLTAERCPGPLLLHLQTSHQWELQLYNIGSDSVRPLGTLIPTAWLSTYHTESNSAPKADGVPLVRWSADGAALTCAYHGPRGSVAVITLDVAAGTFTHAVTIPAADGGKRVCVDFDLSVTGKFIAVQYAGGGIRSGTDFRLSTGELHMVLPKFRLSRSQAAFSDTHVMVEGYEPGCHQSEHLEVFDLINKEALSEKCILPEYVVPMHVWVDPWSCQPIAAYTVDWLFSEQYCIDVCRLDVRSGQQMLTRTKPHVGRDDGIWALAVILHQGASPDMTKVVSSRYGSDYEYGHLEQGSSPLGIFDLVTGDRLFNVVENPKLPQVPMKYEAGTTYWQWSWSCTSRHVAVWLDATASFSKAKRGVWIIDTKFNLVTKLACFKCFCKSLTFSADGSIIAARVYAADADPARYPEDTHGMIVRLD